MMLPKFSPCPCCNTPDPEVSLTIHDPDITRVSVLKATLTVTCANGHGNCGLTIVKTVTLADWEDAFVKARDGLTRWATMSWNRRNGLPANQRSTLKHNRKLKVSEVIGYALVAAKRRRARKAKQATVFKTNYGPLGLNVVGKEYGPKR